MPVGEVNPHLKFNLKKTYPIYSQDGFRKLWHILGTYVKTDPIRSGKIIIRSLLLGQNRAKTTHKY